jgi:hypothetical protein
MRSIFLAASDFHLLVCPSPACLGYALPLLTHACRSSNEIADVKVSMPEPSAPPPSTRSNQSLKEAAVGKAVDVAVSNPQATKKIIVAAAGASDI